MPAWSAANSWLRRSASKRAHDDLVAAVQDALAGAAELVGGAAAGDAARDHEADAEDLRQAARASGPWRCARARRPCGRR